MAWDDLTGTDVRVTGSSVESARFGVSIARLTVGCELPTNGPKFDAAATAVSVALARSPDDVVVPVITDDGLDVVPATLLPGSADRVGDRMVADAVADSFAGYGNHYLANPLLDSAAALAGYQEWARRSLSGERDALVLAGSGRPIGVATLVGSHDGTSHLEVLLAGLVSAAQGRGSHALLLTACAGEARRRGLSRLIISTQVHIVRVPRAWARLGLRPFAAVETVHAARAGRLGDRKPVRRRVPFCGSRVTPPRG